MVTIFDPEGFPINLIHGQEPRAGQEPPEKIVSNYEKDKPRVRKFLRFEPGPAAVHKVCEDGIGVLVVSWLTE